MKQIISKLFSRVAAVAVFATAFAGTVSAEKITSYAGIVSGTKYYIGATTGGTDYYLSVDGTNLSTSIAGTAVTSNSSATPFTFTGSGTSWTIQFDSGYYLSLKNGKDNGKVQVVENASTFTASNQSSKLRLSIGSYSIQKNNNGAQFGSYGNTQTDLWLEPVSGGSTSTFAVTYYSNGGTGTMIDANSPYNSGATVTVMANAFTRDNYSFSKWNTAANGSGTDYSEGDTFTINSNVSLYAQWTENITGSPAILTASNLQLTGSYTTNTEKTVGGITYVYSDLMLSNERIQARASSGTIQNSTPYPGDITSVKITHTGTARESTIYGSANGTTWSPVATGSGSVIADFSGKGYKYFKITRGSSNAAYWTSIEIDYSESSSSQTASDLAITNSSTELAFDLYNNAAAQVISYTTSSTGDITVTPASPTSYFSYVHDATAKTITVTPLAVTPNSQTVTISQDADDSYYSGSVSFTVSIANTAPLADLAALKSQTAANTYSVALNNAVVTYVNGNYAYIQDASAAIVMYKNGHGLSAGDVLSGTATVAFQIRNGNPQITDLSGITKVAGSAPAPTSVDASSWNYTFNNVLSQYFEITGATLTSTNSKYYASLGEETVQLYKVGAALGELDLTRSYTVTGFPTMYNDVKELYLFDDPVAEASTTPIITIAPLVANHSASDEEGTLNITYENLPIEGVGDFNIEFYEAVGGNPSGEPDWIHVEIAEQDPNIGEGYVISYIMDPNTGEARSTYFVVFANDSEDVAVYSDVVTINQAAPVIDYATLPFEYDGNGTGDLPAGFTVSGLGTYSSSPAMKFDGTGDYAILKFNEFPGVLTFDIKGNAFSGGTFTVQTSADGVTYTDLASYTELAATQNVAFDNVPESARFIKWVYTEKVSGNVALGNITLDKKQPASPDTYELNLTAGDGGCWGTFYNGVADYQLPEGAQAFTMNASKQLYRLGSNGRIIPAGTAVVIIADVEAVTLTKGGSPEPVAVNGGDNILLGDDFPVEGDGTQYVLGKKNNVIGFYKFLGSDIPANKAYYVVSE